MAQPYLTYKFLGTKSFITTLEDTETKYHLFDSDDTSGVIESHRDLFTDPHDVICNGFMKRDNTIVYFSEFAFKITKSYRAHLVFMFDHHPTNQELCSIAETLVSIVEQELDGVDVQGISETLEKNHPTLN